MEELDKVEVRAGRGNPLLTEYDRSKPITDVKGEKTMDEKKLFAFSTVDLYMFNEDGRKVMECRTLLNTSLKKDEYERCVLEVMDAAFNIHYLKLLSRIRENELSDYEKVLRGNNSRSFIVNFSEKNDSLNNSYKVVLEGMLASPDCDTNYAGTYMIVLPNVKLSIRNFSFDTSSDGVSTIPMRFYAYPYNEDGDIFEVKVNEY